MELNLGTMATNRDPRRISSTRAERSSNPKIFVGKTGPDETLLTPHNSGRVIAEESPHSDSFDFVEAEFHESESLETDFNSGIVPTDDVRGRIHLAVEIGSVTLDASYEPGTTRTFERSKVSQKILDITEKELNRSHRSMMIVANGSMQVIEGKVELPLTIEELTRLCEVRFAEHLDTKMFLGLDAQAEFDMYFGSRLKKVFMPDKAGRHNPLKTWLVEEEGRGGIADLLDDEQGIHLRDLIRRNLARAYRTQVKYYDKHRRDGQFKMVDLVFKRERVLSNKEKDIAAKLPDKFSGPYKVVRRLSPVVFRLVDARGKYAGREHSRHLKPYVASTDQSGDEYPGK